MSRRTLHLSSTAALLAWSSVAPPSQAQLPLFAPDAAAELPPEPPPATDAAPPEAPTALTPTPGASASPTALAPAKVEAIGFGQHPYYDDEDELTELAPRRTWYGWQTLVVDGAALSAVLAGAAMDRGASGSEGGVVAVAGLLTYELGPGVVHFVHRNPGRGFASFGMRLGMPLAGAFLGASFSSNCDSYRCEDDGAAAGALVGMVGAIAIDAAVFAYDDRRSRASHARPRFVPLASLQPGRTWLGFGGEL